MNEFSPMDQSFTRKLDEIILANLENEHFGVKELTREIGMSRFALNRKLHLIHRKTINQYIREMRLNQALKMLIQEHVTASEVAFKVGFSSPAYFSTCFSEYFGYPPGEARKRSLDNAAENREGISSELPVAEQDRLHTASTAQGWKKRGSLTVASVSLIVVFIMALTYFSRLITDYQNKNQKRSIAVLPFINDSKDPENVYFINGVMEAILDNLAKIKDLEVRPRTSVEQYRNNKDKTIPQIAREIGVNYVIEGSGQKIGDEVSLYIQLIEAGSDKHLFSQRYNMKLEDIFNLQSEVAIKVASEIKAAITIEEKELIEKAPTRNIAAMNLFLQANDLHNIAESEGIGELEIKAEHLYRKAIQLDSNYADPYVSLGWIVLKRNIDSAQYLVNRALQIDDKNPEAYILKGYVYYYKGQENEAEQSFLLSIKYKPNNSAAFRNLGELYFGWGNCYDAIKNQLKAFHLENNSMQERDNLETFCATLYSLGFYEEGKKYAAKQLELDHDSSNYYWSLATVDLDLGDYKSALKSSLKMYACDTDDLENTYLLFYNYLYLRDFKEADRLMRKCSAIMQQQGKIIEPDYLFGFACFENGQEKEADFHFKGTIEQMLKYIDQDQPSVTCRAYLTLAKIYSVRNEKAKALENLQKVRDCMGFMIIPIKDYKNCTMFDNIRQEPAFAEYLIEAEARYRIEHDKVEQLLREEGIFTASL